MSAFRSNIRAYAIACGILTAAFLGTIMLVSGEFQRKANILQGTLSGVEMLTSGVSSLQSRIEAADTASAQEAARTLLRQLRYDTAHVRGQPYRWPASASAADADAAAEWNVVLRQAEALVDALASGSGTPGLAQNAMDLQSAMMRAYGRTGHALADLWASKTTLNQMGTVFATALLLGNLYFLLGHVLIVGTPDDPVATGLIDASAPPGSGAHLDLQGQALQAVERLSQDRSHLVMLLSVVPATRQDAQDQSGNNEDGVRALEACVRRGLTLLNDINRVSVDTFVASCPVEPGQKAAAVHDSVTNALRAENEDTTTVILPRTVSGAAILRPHRSAGLALRNAKLALDASRDSGKDFTLYTPALKRACLAHDRLTEELEQAIERKEFLAFFQPQIDISTQRVVGLEALARWQHPRRGLVPPMEFLPLLFANGRSTDLAIEMLNQAAEALVAFGRAGHFVQDVGVNVSREELLSPHLAEHVQWSLEKHDLMPERLRIEILETIQFGGHGDPAIAALRQLSDLGVRVDLDDFGTGNTSIKGFRQLPLDRVKIDRSYIRNLDTDPANRELVKAIVSMGHALKVDVLAEGVETAQELRVLARLGCDHVQGYYFAKPMALEETIAWLDTHMNGQAASRDTGSIALSNTAAQAQQAG